MSSQKLVQEAARTGEIDQAKQWWRSPALLAAGLAGMLFLSAAFYFFPKLRSGNPNASNIDNDDPTTSVGAVDPASGATNRV